MADENNNQAQQNQQAQTQDLNQLLKIRRDKLAELQSAGKDPFKITKYDVTVHSQDAKAKFEALDSELTSSLPEGLSEEESA